MIKWTWPLWGSTLKPDIEAFNQSLRRSVNAEHHDGTQVAIDFRRLFMRDAELGKRVLFMILTWCGEYDDSILEGEALIRAAGKREIAWQIKAAIHANIDQPPLAENDNAESD